MHINVGYNEVTRKVQEVLLALRLPNRVFCCFSLLVNYAFLFLNLFVCFSICLFCNNLADMRLFSQVERLYSKEERWREEASSLQRELDEMRLRLEECKNMGTEKTEVGEEEGEEKGEQEKKEEGEEEEDVKRRGELDHMGLGLQECGGCIDQGCNRGGERSSEDVREKRF